MFAWRSFFLIHVVDQPSRSLLLRDPRTSKRGLRDNIFQDFPFFCQVKDGQTVDPL